MKTYNKIKVVIAATLCCFLSSCGEQKPEDVAIEATKALRDCDVDTLMEITHFKSEQEKAMLKSMLGEKLARSMAQDKELRGEITKIDVEETTISEDGNTAKVILNIHFEKGDPKNNPVDLIKVKGKWYISELR